MKTVLADLWVLYITIGLIACHIWAYAWLWRVHTKGFDKQWEGRWTMPLKYIGALFVVAFILMFYWPSWFVPKYRARMMQYFPPKYQKPATEL